MKQKYVAMKMYLIGLTVGLFIWGWSAMSQPAAAQSNTIASNTTVQTQSSRVQTVTNQPRVRTRTS